MEFSFQIVSSGFREYPLLSVEKYEAPNKRLFLEQDNICGPNGFYTELRIETRVYVTCTTNNQATLPWAFIDLRTPYRWPNYRGTDLNSLETNYTFGPDAIVGNEPVKNVITTRLDFQGFNLSTILGISKNTGLPQEGSNIYGADGTRQVFNIRFENFNQAFNLTPPLDAQPFNGSVPALLSRPNFNLAPGLPDTSRSQPTKFIDTTAPGEILVKFQAG